MFLWSKYHFSKVKQNHATFWISQLVINFVIWTSCYHLSLWSQPYKPLVVAPQQKSSAPAMTQPLTRQPVFVGFVRTFKDRLMIMWSCGYCVRWDVFGGSGDVCLWYGLVRTRCFVFQSASVCVSGSGNELWEGWSVSLQTHLMPLLKPCVSVTFSTFFSFSPSCFISIREIPGAKRY